MEKMLTELVRNKIIHEERKKKKQKLELKSQQGAETVIFPPPNRVNKILLTEKLGIRLT